MVILIGVSESSGVERVGQAMSASLAVSVPYCVIVCFFMSV